MQLPSQVPGLPVTHHDRTGALPRGSLPISTTWRATSPVGPASLSTSGRHDPVIAISRTPNGGTWESFHTACIYYLAGPDVDPSRMPLITDDDWLAPAD